MFFICLNVIDRYFIRIILLYYTEAECQTHQSYRGKYFIPLFMSDYIFINI